MQWAVRVCQLGIRWCASRPTHRTSWEVSEFRHLPTNTNQPRQSTNDQARLAADADRLTWASGALGGMKIPHRPEKGLLAPRE
jgi:hypothetical protein